MGAKVKVVIIGAGSAGISALREVRRITDDYVIIDNGPLGTKCARVGCMPSKALISAANDYHKRENFKTKGINGSENLSVDIPQVLKHVRSLRDHFAGSMAKVTKELAADKLITSQAKIISQNTVQAGDQLIETEKIIIATGAKPRIPQQWQKFGKRILTTDDIFELEDIPQDIAAIGLGPVGLEIGQSLSRLGINITGFTSGHRIAAMDNPYVNKAAIDIIGKEFPIYRNSPLELSDAGGKIRVSHPDTEVEVDAVILSIGVEPNITDIGLENLNINLDERGLPSYDRRTMQIENLPVFITGDANGCRPILHEALDEGLIAGYNACAESTEKFCRRSPLKIVFSDPEIASAGFTYKQLTEQDKEFVIGEVNFADQARAELEMRNSGLMHIYADKNTAVLLGADLVCPDGEHMIHQLAMAIQNKLTISDMLKMPYYHPTITEALRTALRDAAKKLSQNSKIDELGLCQSCPEEPLC
ncbi:MAG: dihydrolipoyl dehydrogenase [Sedimentisphaeraceae bacterium JB056]